MTTELHSVLEKHFDTSHTEQAPDNTATGALDPIAKTETTPEPPQAPDKPLDTVASPTKPADAVDGSRAQPAHETAQKAETDKPADTQPTEPELRAPAGWTPIVREQWGSLPSDVKKEIARREDEINRAMIQATQDRKFAQEFSQITKKYDGALQGLTPAQAYESTLQYAQRLGGANQADKAKAIVDLIDEYGVNGEALAAALTGAPTTPRPSAVEQENARLKHELDTLRQTGQGDATAKQAADDLKAFAAKNEFFDDVKVVMGHLMAAAASQGFETNLDQAYEQACRIVPSVKAVLDQRAINKTQQRQAAAVSVKSSPTGTTIKTTGNPNASTRDLLESYFDKYNP